MQTPSTPAAEYCGTQEAAKLLGLSVGTVQSLVERGELSAWKTSGGHRRISLKALHAYKARLGNGSAPDDESQPAALAPTVLKLLVVDDDISTRELIQGWVEEWGMPINCTLKAAAMEALIDIGRNLPDVLITDLRMPGVDGFEFLRLLGANPNYRSVVILVMTGMTDEELAAKGQLPERVVVIRKPLNSAWMHGFFTASMAHLLRSRH
jgi:excisionase family DNA binding protein